MNEAKITIESNGEKVVLRVTDNGEDLKIKGKTKGNTFATQLAKHIKGCL